jgi:hypothetical protein
LCNAARLNDYTYIVPTGDTLGELYLTRIPDTGAVRGKTELNNTYSLRTFIQDTVNYYLTELKKVDAEYGKTVKAYIGAVDSKARTNLASLADQLTNCQFNLPSVEYAISFVNCSAPPATVKQTPAPGVISTTFMPPGAGPNPGNGPGDQGPVPGVPGPGGPGSGTQPPGLGMTTTSSPRVGLLSSSQINYGGSVGTFGSNNNTFNIRF